jgi:hypothetical protein
VAALLALVAAFAFRPQVAPGSPLPSTPLRDFEAAYAAGAARNAEDDPYSRQLWRSERTIPGVTATRDELLPFVGPPFGLPLWSAFARLDYARATLLWSLVLGLSFALLTLGSLKLAGQAGASDYLARPTGAFDALAALAIGASFAPLTGGLALGQVAVLACAAAVATQFALARRNALVAALTAFAAALQPNLAIVLAARLPERRATLAFALAAALAIGCSAAALGSAGDLARYATLLREHAAAESGLAIQTTVASVALCFGASAAGANIVAFAIALAALGGLVALFATRRYAGLERFAITSAALPLALPFAHEHDFTLALLPAMLCARRCTGATWLAASVAATLVAVNWLGLAANPSALVQSLCLATAAALALAALGPAQLGLARFAPLCVVPVVAFAGALAASHPLPVWPDALPAAFHADRALSLAQVWRAEQLAAGLGRRDAVWSALRACTLLGSGVLAYAAARGLHSAQRTPTD